MDRSNREDKMGDDPASFKGQMAARYKERQSMGFHLTRDGKEVTTSERDDLERIVTNESKHQKLSVRRVTSLDARREDGKVENAQEDVPLDPRRSMRDLITHFEKNSQPGSKSSSAERQAPTPSGSGLAREAWRASNRALQMDLDIAAETSSSDSISMSDSETSPGRRAGRRRRKWKGNSLAHELRSASNINLDLAVINEQKPNIQMGDANITTLGADLIKGLRSEMANVSHEVEYVRQVIPQQSVEVLEGADSQEGMLKQSSEIQNIEDKVPEPLRVNLKDFATRKKRISNQSDVKYVVHRKDWKKIMPTQTGPHALQTNSSNRMLDSLTPKSGSQQSIRKSALDLRFLRRNLSSTMSVSSSRTTQKKSFTSASNTQQRVARRQSQRNLSSSPLSSTQKSTGADLVSPTPDKNQQKDGSAMDRFYQFLSRTNRDSEGATDLRLVDVKGRLASNPVINQQETDPAHCESANSFVPGTPPIVPQRRKELSQSTLQALLRQAHDKDHWMRLAANGAYQKASVNTAANESLVQPQGGKVLTPNVTELAKESEMIRHTGETNEWISQQNEKDHQNSGQAWVLTDAKTRRPWQKGSIQRTNNSTPATSTGRAGKNNGNRSASPRARGGHGSHPVVESRSRSSPAATRGQGYPAQTTGTAGSSGPQPLLDGACLSLNPHENIQIQQQKLNQEQQHLLQKQQLLLLQQHQHQLQEKLKQHQEQIFKQYQAEKSSVTQDGKHSARGSKRSEDAAQKDQKSNSPGKSRLASNRQSLSPAGEHDVRRPNNATSSRQAFANKVSPHGKGKIGATSASQSPVKSNKQTAHTTQMAQQNKRALPVQFNEQKPPLHQPSTNNTIPNSQSSIYSYSQDISAVNSSQTQSSQTHPNQVATYPTNWSKPTAGFAKLNSETSVLGTGSKPFSAMDTMHMLRSEQEHDLAQKLEGKTKNAKSHGGLRFAGKRILKSGSALRQNVEVSHPSSSSQLANAGPSGIAVARSTSTNTGYSNRQTQPHRARSPRYAHTHEPPTTLVGEHELYLQYQQLGEKQRGSPNVVNEGGQMAHPEQARKVNQYSAKTTQSSAMTPNEPSSLVENLSQNQLSEEKTHVTGFLEKQQHRLTPQLLRIQHRAPTGKNPAAVSSAASILVKDRWRRPQTIGPVSTRRVRDVPGAEANVDGSSRKRSTSGSVSRLDQMRRKLASTQSMSGEVAGPGVGSRGDTPTQDTDIKTAEKMKTLVEMPTPEENLLDRAFHRATRTGRCSMSPRGTVSRNTTPHDEDSVGCPRQAQGNVKELVTPGADNMGDFEHEKAMSCHFGNGTDNEVQASEVSTIQDEKNNISSEETVSTKRKRKITEKSKKIKKKKKKKHENDDTGDDHDQKSTKDKLSLRAKSKLGKAAEGEGNSKSIDAHSLVKDLDKSRRKSREISFAESAIRSIQGSPSTRAASPGSTKVSSNKSSLKGSPKLSPPGGVMSVAIHRHSSFKLSPKPNRRPAAKIPTYKPVRQVTTAPTEHFPNHSRLPVRTMNVQSVTSIVSSTKARTELLAKYRRWREGMVEPERISKIPLSPSFRWTLDSAVVEEWVLHCWQPDGGIYMDENGAWWSSGLDNLPDPRLDKTLFADSPTLSVDGMLDLSSRLPNAKVGPLRLAHASYAAAGATCVMLAHLFARLYQCGGEDYDLFCADDDLECLMSLPV